MNFFPKFNRFFTNKLPPFGSGGSQEPIDSSPMQPPVSSPPSSGGSSGNHGSITDFNPGSDSIAPPFHPPGSQEPIDPPSRQPIFGSSSDSSNGDQSGSIPNDPISNRPSTNPIRVEIIDYFRNILNRWRAK